MQPKNPTVQAEFVPMENGPLRVRGAFRMVNSEGHEIKTGKEIFLCRCGHSGNKPFCDGSHRKAGFRG